MPFGRPTGQSDFNSGELRLVTMRTGNDLLKLQIPVTLVQRTMWGLHVAVNAGTDWFISARLTMSNGGGIVAELPFNAGNSTAGAATVMPKSLPCVLVPGVGPVGRSLFIAVANPLVGPPAEAQSYYLQPFDIEIEADLLTLSIDQFANVTSLHSFLAVQSTLTPGGQ